LLHIPEEVKSNDWHWDLSPSKKPEHATFSDDNLKITKTSGGGRWNCPVIGSSPVSEFTVQIISGQSIRIGLCPIEQFKQNGYHFQLTNACFFKAYDGEVYYNGGEYKSYSSHFKVNDKLTAIITGSSIRLLKNGNDLVEAINNTVGEMYPVVELFNVGDSVMIVANP
jgi:hypothetical protein